MVRRRRQPVESSSKKRNFKLAIVHLAASAVTTNSTRRDGYGYSDEKLNSSHAYLVPNVLTILHGLNLSEGNQRIFELGCGNGSVANELSKYGFDITGVDPSPDGFRYAKEHYSHLRISHGSAYDDLSTRYGKFPTGMWKCLSAADINPALVFCNITSLHSSSKG